MECKNCAHSEVCKYIDDFKSSKECIDRTLFNDKPIVIESKCTQYKDKDINTSGSIIPNHTFTAGILNNVKNKDLGEPFKITY